MNGAARTVLAFIAGLIVAGMICLFMNPAKAAECFPLPIGRILDADTICMVDETPCQPKNAVRLAGVDAPETHRPSCERERMLGLLAAQRATMLIRGAENVLWCPSGKGYYGRHLATVLADGEDVGRALVVDGLAREWTGKREGWCNE